MNKYSLRFKNVEEDVIAAFADGFDTAMVICEFPIHYHVLIHTDLKSQSVRDRVKKFATGNVEYSLKDVYAKGGSLEGAENYLCKDLDKMDHPSRIVFLKSYTERDCVEFNRRYKQYFNQNGKNGSVSPLKKKFTYYLVNTYKVLEDDKEFYELQWVQRLIKDGKRKYILKEHISRHISLTADKYCQLFDKLIYHKWFYVIYNRFYKEEMYSVFKKWNDELDI